MPVKPKSVRPHLYTSRLGGAEGDDVGQRIEIAPEVGLRLVSRATRPSKVSKNRPKQMASAAR